MVPTVLLVDSDTDALCACKQALARAGYEVVSAATQHEALAYVSQRVPDVVVTETRLSDDEGLQCLKHLKTLASGLPVILYSAYAIYRDDFTSWLAVAYCLKGAETTKLLDAVRTAVVAAGLA